MRIGDHMPLCKEALSFKLVRLMKFSIIQRMIMLRPFSAVDISQVFSAKDIARRRQMLLHIAPGLVPFRAKVLMMKIAITVCFRGHTFAG